MAAFGGDPFKVTIGGQSAGSMSAQALIISPLTKGLTNGAIAESGAGRSLAPLFLRRSTFTSDKFYPPSVWKG